MASLKQAKRNGMLNFQICLLSHKYTIFTTNHSLFLKHDGNHTTTIMVYVDIVVLTGNNPMEI